jgi:hypothetical protein
MIPTISPAKAREGVKLLKKMIRTARKEKQLFEQNLLVELKTYLSYMKSLEIEDILETDDGGFKCISHVGNSWEFIMIGNWDGTSIDQSIVYKVTYTI